jgi:hypothetical protein
MTRRYFHFRTNEKARQRAYAESSSAPTTGSMPLETVLVDKLTAAPDTNYHQLGAPQGRMVTDPGRRTGRVVDDFQRNPYDCFP